MRTHRAILVSIALSLLAIPFASATDFTWSNAPSTDNWNTATNWMPNGIPSTSSDRAFFGDSAQLSVTVTQSVSVRA